MSSNGTALNTTVSRGGRVSLEYGAVASNTTVLAGGRLDAAAYSTVTGLQIEQGATVVFNRNSNVNFRLADQQPDSEVQINAWNRITDNGATYTVTVSATQAEGTYRLAAGAELFTGSVTVKNTAAQSYGTLAVGETLTVSGVDYQLNLVDGLLSFTVGNEAPVPPVTTTAAKSDINGNGISDVLFQYTGGDYQLGFWLDGTDTWQGQGLSEPAEWEVLGAYDLSSDGKADVVMLGNVTVNGIKGAFVGYRKNGDMSSWENISYLTNAEGLDWRVKVGNLTGNAGQNSLAWHAPELGAVGGDGQLGQSRSRLRPELGDDRSRGLRRRRRGFDSVLICQWREILCA